MQARTWISGFILVGTTAAVAACSSTIDWSSESALDVEPAQLVAQKREWLENYDAHCSACFQAFDLCEQGAEEAELDSCQLALDACVRGGLLAKAQAGDAGLDEVVERQEDEDAGRALGDVADDEQALADGAVDLRADADIEEQEDEDAIDEDGDVLEAEPKRDRVFDEDPNVGVDVDDQREDQAEDEVDAGRAAERDQDAANAKVKEAVEACLDEARLCLDGDAADDAEQCVAPLQACVKQSLEGTFDEVCEEQVRRCRMEGGSSERLRRVERQCAEELRI